MSMSCEDHGNAVFVGHVDGFLVTDGAARLNDSGDACFACCFDGVTEGEECIGAHDGAFGFFTSFCNGDIGRTYAVHLTSANAQGGVFVGQNDSIGFHVFYDDPSKFQGFPFFFGGSTVGNDFAVRSGFGAVVWGLYQKAAGYFVYLQFFMGQSRYFDEANIFLCGKNIKGFLGEFRSHDDFKENRFHRFCCFFVAFPVHSNDTAESGFAVCRKGFLECIESIFTKSTATWIGMFDDSASRLVFPFGSQVPSSFHVDNVVVRQFFAVELFGVRNAAFGFRVFVESRLLVRVFTVTQVLHFHVRMAVYIRQYVMVTVHFFGQVISDGAVVQTGVQEGFSGKGKAEIFGQCVVFDSVQDVVILGRIHHDGYIFIVLSCRTYHGRTTDIDVFDGFCAGDVRFCNGFTEWIQVNSHQVDTGDAVFFHGFHMVWVITDSQDAAVNLWMQSLYSAIHHFRKTSHFGNRFHWNASVGNGFHGAASRNNFYAQFMKPLSKGNHTGFIRYADERSFNCHVFSSFYVIVRS